MNRSVVWSMGAGRHKLMRIDRARATETVETIARIESKDDGAELELGQLIKAWLHQSGWDVESREVLGSASAAGVRRWLAYLTYGLTAAALSCSRCADSRPSGVCSPAGSLSRAGCCS